MMETMKDQKHYFRCGRFHLPLNVKTYLMGIINVTPDSFSDGGLYLGPDEALRQAERLMQAGADILDVGGESTRPGSEPVSCQEELQRVLPVVTAIASRFDCPVSVDTAKSAVAQAALEAGAVIINDVTGLQTDPQMAQVGAEFDAGVIIMHNARLYPAERGAGGEDIIASMENFMRRSLNIACQACLLPEQLVLDPGIGFGVNTAESLAMIRCLTALKAFGLPVLVGPSRKRFIGEILKAPVEERLLGTAAAVAVSIAHGADFVRVHDVRQMADVVKVADAICRGNQEESPCQQT